MQLFANDFEEDLLLLARRSMSEALMLQALPVWRGPSVCHHM